MAYTLKYTNGDLLVTLPDQQSDRLTTSLTLIGKNVNAYGTDINQNYIGLLENFAYTVAPSNALTGQLWFDTGPDQQIKVLTVNKQWKTVGSPAISSTQPTILSPGDLWYDTTAKQLKFADTSDSLVVIGPMYDSTVGKSGWVTERVIKSDASSATVSNLYSNNILMGILSDTALTLASNTLTGTTLVGVGFNPSWTSAAQTKFLGTATFAEALFNSSTNTMVYADQFLSTAVAITTTNVLRVLNDDPAGSVIIGTAQDFTFISTTGTNTATLFLSSQHDYDISITPADLSGRTSAIHFGNAGSGNLGFFNATPTEKVDIIGNVKIQGDLFVYGTSTYIESQDLKVIDKNIELGSTTSPTNDTADGGGIVLKSSATSSNPAYSSVVGRDKQIAWFNTSPSPNTFLNTWSISDNLELSFVDSQYAIWGQPVLNRTTLGATVTASSLISVGALENVTAGRITLGRENYSGFPLTSTATTIGILGPTTGTIVIGDHYTFEIDVNQKRIINLPDIDPLELTTPPTQAVNKKYVDDQLAISANLRAALTIDISGQPGNEVSTSDLIDDYVIEQLQFVYPTNTASPAYNTPDGTIARVICVKYVTHATTATSTQADNGTPLIINYVDPTGNPQTATVIEYFPKYQFITPIPEAQLTSYKVIKQYVTSGGVWMAEPGKGALNVLHTEGTW
jgi:hypothetical protein